MNKETFPQKVIVALIGSLLATSSIGRPEEPCPQKKSRSASAAAPRSARSPAAPSA